MKRRNRVAEPVGKHTRLVVVLAAVAVLSAGLLPGQDTDDGVDQLLGKIERITDELQEIYSLPEDEIANHQERIEELTDELTRLEERAHELSMEMEEEPEPAYEPELPDDEPVYTEVPESEPEPETAPAETAAPDTPVIAAKDRIRRLVLLGNDRTESVVLRRAVAIRKNRPYNQEVHDFSLLRLDRLNVLYERRFTLLPDTAGGGRTLFLRVSDMHGIWVNPVDFLIKKGIEAADGRLSLTWHNIDGRAKNLTLGTEWEWWHWDKKQAAFLEYAVPWFFRWPLISTFYLFDRKVTWYSGLFEEDDVTVLRYGGGARWYNLFNRWLEGRAGLEYYQRTFNRTWADGDILSAWTEWELTTRRIRPVRDLNYGTTVLLDYNFYHPMGRFDNLGHYGRLRGSADIGTGIGRRVIATDRFTGGITTHDIPVDRRWHAGTDDLLRGHPKRAMLGTALAHNMFELQVLVHDRVTLAGFSDIGCVWPGWADVNPIDLEFDFGAGIIAQLPWIGPVRFDYAVNPEHGTWNMYLKGL